MLKKFRLDKGIPWDKPNEEIFDYPDDTDKETIEKDFAKWVLHQLDVEIIDIDKENDTKFTEEEIARFKEVCDADLTRFKSITPYIYELLTGEVDYSEPIPMEHIIEDLTLFIYEMETYLPCDVVVWENGEGVTLWFA